MSFRLEDWEADGHRSELYRTDGETRHSVPVEICRTCSDRTGTLVPVSFCTVLGPLVEQEYRALFGPPPKEWKPAPEFEVTNFWSLTLWLDE